MSASQKIEEYLELRKRKLEIEDELKSINKTIWSAEADVLEAMEYENMEETVIKGVKVKPVTEQDFKLAGEAAGGKWDDYPEFHQWLKDNGLDGVIKTKPSVHAGTRKSTLKEFVENGGTLPEWIAETFNSRVKVSDSQVRKELM